MLTVSLLIAATAEHSDICSTMLFAQQSDQAMRKFADMLGRTVMVPHASDIKRVAVLTSPQVQIMYIVGAQDKLCAMTASQYRFKLFEKFYPRQAKIPAPRSHAASMNVEQLLAAHPQFCIGSSTDMDLVQKTTHIPTVRIDTGDPPSKVFETRKAEVKMFGKIFGAEARAQKYTDYLDATLSMLKTKVGSLPVSQRKKIYLGFGSDHLTTYGGDTFMQYQIEAAGLLNAAQNVTSTGGKEGGLANVNMEDILSWNPDVMVIDTGSVQEIKKSPVWEKVNAVKNNRVYILPVGGFIWNRPSCESAVLFPTWIAMMTYPEKFGSLTIQNEIKRYWKQILGFTLSDSDVHSILNPPTYAAKWHNK